MTPPVLRVNNLTTAFGKPGSEVVIVDRISFDLQRGQTLAIVGESGCGKSILSLSIMQLTPDTARIQGEVLLDGTDLLGLSPAGMRRIRGRRISMIFQEPMTSLNPIMSVGAQLTEALGLYFPDLSRAEARARAIAGLERVRLPRPEAVFDRYPHELSGGMRQRVMIAMALACEPDILIADEPTTALDVTVQAGILELIRDLQRDSGMAVVLVTHDLGVVAEYADEVMVMYAGRVVERGAVGQIFHDAQHPYTIGLMGSIPQVGHDGPLLAIEGTVPPQTAMPPGCRFAPRCVFTRDPCHSQPPPMTAMADGHAVACHLAPLEETA